MDGPRFAKALLPEELDERSPRRCPRGAAPDGDRRPAQVQWRGLAAARGTLHEGDGWAVALEAQRGAASRAPAGATCMVFEATSLAGVVAAIRPFGHHLKTVGVAGDETDRVRVRDALAPTLAPRVCSVGAMQRPPLDALADGRPLTEGFVRWARDE